MGFDFEIEYKRGDNVVANALSRRHEAEKFDGSLLAFSQSIPHWVDAIKEALELDFAVKELIENIQQNEALGPWKLVDGLILYKEHIYLPSSSTLTNDIIREFHGSTHEGYVKTFHVIKANFFWKRMEK